MTSSRPYLIRALYEWINDNRLSAHILVNTQLPNVSVPTAYVQEGKIVFDISPDAIEGLCIGNSKLEFSACFAGIPKHISVPIRAVEAIYAQENGEGMPFGDEPGDEDAKEEPVVQVDKKISTKKSHLKIVK